MKFTLLPRHEGIFLLDLMAARESRTIHIIGNSQPFYPGADIRSNRSRIDAPPFDPHPVKLHSMNEKNQWNVHHWNFLERKRFTRNQCSLASRNSTTTHGKRRYMWQARGTIDNRKTNIQYEPPIATTVSISNAENAAETWESSSSYRGCEIAEFLVAKRTYRFQQKRINQVESCFAAIVTCVLGKIDRERERDKEGKRKGS